MRRQTYKSWGNLPFGKQKVIPLLSRSDPLPTLSEGETILPYGNGRSYGDSCLNTDGALIDTRYLDHMIQFDRERGVVTCESGVFLKDLLTLLIPDGWCLPVLPGTQFVTVGGAIANDVHGKNHSQFGSFGCHVLQFELLRSDGRRLLCSPTQNEVYYHATIGGLGLTGVIVWAQIQARPISSTDLECETIKFSGVEDFFRLEEDSQNTHEYRVAWIDCLSKGTALGRGHYSRANHADGRRVSRDSLLWKKRISFPLTPPISAVNKFTLQAFNSVYFHRQRKTIRKDTLSFETFFFPLDHIRQWNRMYGPRGFYQYQCVLPMDQACTGVTTLLRMIASGGIGSFLVVLKAFGDCAAPGMLSFSRPGVTLALDIPNHGQRTLDALSRLDEIVLNANGALYPAKDARMPPDMFRASFPRLDEFIPLIDPVFSSSFWRRIQPTSQSGDER